MDIRPDIAPDITPDTKDWTWVLDRPCPDCGLDTSRVSGSAVPGILRTSADSWRSALRRQYVQERPNPSTWAPMEYACHVRDVCLLFDSRLGLMLTMDDPEFDNWDQDATAIRQRYTDAIPQVDVVMALGSRWNPSPGTSSTTWCTTYTTSAPR